MKVKLLNLDNAKSDTIDISDKILNHSVKKTRTLGAKEKAESTFSSGDESNTVSKKCPG